MGANNNIFSKNLQALRKKQGVTQEQLASFLGVSPQAVSKWENGSYPEGDLLPKISEFFGVSISYLYGQEKEKVSIEQGVLDELYEIAHPENPSDNSHNDYFEKMLDIAWAFQIGCWKENSNYYKRSQRAPGCRIASVITSDAGFGYFNLDPSKQFYTIVKEPENGFANNIQITEKLRSFFAMLGKKGALEILEFMLTLGYGECITVSSLAEKIGLSADETSKLLQEAGKFIDCSSNPPFRMVNVIGKDGNEIGYGVEQSAISLYISMILAADSIINSPSGYQMQVCSRSGSWLNRDIVEENLKKK